MSHKEFEVVDSKTGENLTKGILLQIITEQESNDQQALLTQTVLKQLIRFYGSEAQTFMRQYLEQSIAVFLDQQDALQNAVSDMVGAETPLTAFNKVMEQNMNWWRQFAPFDPMASARTGTRGSSGNDSSGGSDKSAESHNKGPQETGNPEDNS